MPFQLRPRFSLKWLLIAFTILGVAFYVAFVRPTVIANRFIALVDRDENQKAQALFSDSTTLVFKTTPVIVRAELLPRTWEDVYKMQRRLDVDVIPTQPQVINSKSYHIGMHYQATSSVFGLRGSVPYHLDFPDVEKLKSRLGH